MSFCRVCEHRLDHLILSYHNVPKIAQNLSSTPDKRDSTELLIYQCKHCGVVQLSCDPVPYYRDVIRSSAVSPIMQVFRKQQFADFVSEYCLHDKMVLEVGCGRGEYLSIMSEFCKTTGLEHNREAVEYCKSQGLKVKEGFLDSSNSVPFLGTFDAFYILNFLEHIPDILCFLRILKEKLVDGAVGLIEVPNFDMILRDKLFTEFTPEHLYYFTEDSLRSLMYICGFKVLSCKSICYDYILSAVVQKREELLVRTGFERKQDILTHDVRMFITRFPVKSVAVWGAGHQSLTTMALLGMAKNIQYVVDSAPFKQGKLTPVTHLPIVPPEALITNPVKAVIVMAGSYTDEVAKRIRKEYKGIAVATIGPTGFEEIV